MSASRQEFKLNGLATLFVLALAVNFSVRADLQVNHRQDKVVLLDGTEIVCLVLMETKTGVLIVEADPNNKDKTVQRILPLDKVSKVIHGKPDGTISGFQTEAELAHKVVQGSGFRKEDSGNVKDTGTNWGERPIATTEGTTTPKSNVPASALSPKELQEAYLSRFPGLKDAAGALLGPERTLQLIEQGQKGDPLVRKQLEGLLGMFVKQEAQPAAGAAPAPVPIVNKKRSMQPVENKPDQ